MDPTTILCPTCHLPLRSTDYFCFNCGTKVKTPPPSISLATQIILYLKCLLLPPLGIIWGFKYLRQPDSKSKSVGIAAIVLTLASIIITIIITTRLVNEMNRQINEQMNLIQGF